GGANRPRSRSRETNPATARPTAATGRSAGWAADSAATVSTSRSSRSSAARGVSVSMRAWTRPAASTVPARRFVPPTSMPIVTGPRWVSVIAGLPRADLHRDAVEPGTGTGARAAVAVSRSRRRPGPRRLLAGATGVTGVRGRLAGGARVMAGGRLAEHLTQHGEHPDAVFAHR